MKRIALIALLVAAPLIAQDTTAAPDVVAAAVPAGAVQWTHSARASST